LVNILKPSFYSRGRKIPLTETVKNWKQYHPKYLVLPHPSLRNNIWLKKNPWFENQLVPRLKEKVHGYIF
tara:strand:- start:426 stop:635 length:210 start_codon:yes stop_codon:yes gene_type:complete